METSDRLRLQKLHIKLVRDVRVSYVLPYLMAILTDDDHDLINNQQTERRKTELLLTILPRRGPHAYSCFYEALVENYEWLAEELKSLTVDEKDDMSINKKRAQEINVDMVDVLRENSHLVRNWRILAHRLGMSSCCSNIQIQSNIYMWDLAQCLLALMEQWHAHNGQNATIGKLIDALRQERFNDAADKLEEKFL